MSEDNLNKAATASALVPKPVASGGDLRAWLVAALLAVITVALYWPVIHYDFVLYDDQIYVTSNPQVQAGLSWANVRWAFATGHALNWHPLTWLSLMLDVNLFGRQAAGFHFTNMALHTANVVLLFWLLRLLTGATWRSAWVAALFGWHPIHVESVAWISERKDVLSTFFGFLSLIFYTRYARSQAARPLPNSAFFLSLCCFALGLMSKPMLVTWPFVMLLLDYWPLSRFSPFQPSAFSLQPFREKIPFFALAAAACWITYVVQKQGGAVASLQSVTLGMRMENAVISYVRYLGKILWPTGLSVAYPYRGYWPTTDVLLALVFLCGVTAAVIMMRRRPFLCAGWFWYCGTLIPVIGLVQVGDQAIADRYAYIPSVGVLIMAVWGAPALTRQWRGQAAVLSAAGMATALACLLLTRQQLGSWQNSETLFRHALAVTSNSYSAHRGLGLYFLEQGRNDEAISEFHSGLQLAPDDYLSRAGLGEALLVSGRPTAAADELQAVVRLKPDDYKTRLNWGRALAREGQTNEAIRQFQEGVQLCPDDNEALRALGIILGRPGGGDEATHQYLLALRQRPDYAEACNNLGLDLARHGSIGQAISEFQEALRRDPDFADAHNNLGIALFQLRQIDAAISEFREAVRLKPDLVEAHNNLGSALAAKGLFDEMIVQFQEALRINPASVAAQENLARALARKNQSKAGDPPPVKP